MRYYNSSGREFEIENDQLDNHAIDVCRDILSYINKYKLQGTHYNAIKGAIKSVLMEASMTGSQGR